MEVYFVMKLLPADKDSIRAICNLNDASVIFKEVTLGSNKRYYCNIKTRYTERTGIQIFYKDCKITPKKEKNYILIYEGGKCLYVSGTDLYNKGVNYYRHLSIDSEEFKDKELGHFLRG